MDRMTGSTWSIRTAQGSEQRELSQSPHRTADGVVYPLDEERAAELGELAKLPSLGEVLAAWQQRIAADECRDFRVPFNRLRLTPAGLLSSGKAGLPVTYRVFGHLLRGWTNPPRNVARCLVELPRSTPIHAAGVTPEPVLDSHSPRACAYNAYLERFNAPERRRIELTNEAPAYVTLRSRVLRTPIEGAAPLETRTIIGAVTDTHSLKGGDDQALIAALGLAFAGSSSTARASAFRGIEESELRAVFPALEVEIPGSGTEKWTAYLVARNSESGSKSWSISAGLYRTADGATVACEAVQRVGRHVGQNVTGRMVEVAEGAAGLLDKLIKTAGELAAKPSPWDEEETLRKLRAALAGTVAADPNTCCGIAWALGESASIAPGPITIGTLMNVLGRVAAGCQTRAQARPLEVLAGRVLVEGWGELKAVVSEGEVES